MSSILASLDMSLDDLIASKKKPRSSNPDARPAKKGGRGDAGGAGPVRGRRNRQRNQPYARPNNDDVEGMDVDDDDVPARSGGGKKRSVVVKPVGKGRDAKNGSSILSRLGSSTEKGGQTQGTKIVVKNLKFDILEDDVRELFGMVGKVLKADIVYDRSGRSKGIARVWFDRRADAEKAIKQYDGRTIDGQPMKISLDADSNVRQGLFGTALRDDADVKFKVSFGNADESKGRSGGDRNGGDRNGGDRNGGGRRRRGGRRTTGGGGRGAEKTVEDLDNEMDTYMKDS